MVKITKSQSRNIDKAGYATDTGSHEDEDNVDVILVCKWVGLLKYSIPGLECDVRSRIAV